MADMIVLIGIGLVFAILGIISIVTKKLCIVIVGKSEGGERRWTKCYEGAQAVGGGIVILLVGIGFGVWGVVQYVR